MSIVSLLRIRLSTGVKYVPLKMYAVTSNRFFFGATDLNSRRSVYVRPRDALDADAL